VTTVAEPSPACAPADRAARHHVAGHDQRNTRRGLGCREVKLADASMGVRRAQQVSACLAVQVVVALETAVAAQETLVLETPHRLPDSELAHYLTRSPCR